MKNIIKEQNIPTTTFLGVTIDVENGSSNPKIRKALDKSFKLLDIMEFMKVTKFKLNMVMFDYFLTDGPKGHLYNMLAEGQHGVASSDWKSMLEYVETRKMKILKEI